MFQKYSMIGMKGIDILLDPNFEDEVLETFAQRNQNSMENPDEHADVKEPEDDA